jgi:fibronectin type 3 domain-containing protein
MKLLLQTILTVTLVTLLFSGCSKQPDTPKKTELDSSLPIVQINGYLTDMNSIAFEWKPITHPKVAGVAIYRSQPQSEDKKLHLIKRVESRYRTHFVDNDITPNTRYQYAFTTFNVDEQESHPSKTINVNSLPLLKSVSFFASIGNMPRSAKLVWRPHTNLKVVSYKIERQTLNDPEWAIIATIDGRLNAEYIDEGLDDNEIYKYRIIAQTYDNLDSLPSDIVKVVTKALPKQITNIQATTNIAKQITITWAPSKEEGLDFYNVYRSSTKDGSYDLHVKSRQTSYNDMIEEDGIGYFYKVTAVDADGLESPLSSTFAYGSTLGKLKTPKNFTAKLVNKSAHLNWQKADSRTRSYTLVKTTREGWLSKSTSKIDGITKTELIDMNIKPDILYQYHIIAVDANGIESKPSEIAEISFESKK